MQDDVDGELDDLDDFINDSTNHFSGLCSKSARRRQRYYCEVASAVVISIRSLIIDVCENDDETASKDDSIMLLVLKMMCMDTHLVA